MKNLFKLSLISMILLIVQSNLFSQAGVTGYQVYDHEMRWLCDSASSTTFYRLDLYRPGQAVVTVGNYKPDGSAYTPTSTIKVGPCSGTTSNPDSTYQYYFTQACDFFTGATGTPYIKIWRVGTTTASPGNKTVSFMGNFRADNGASYTPTGTYMDGFCSGWVDKTVTNLQNIISTSTTGSISATNGKFSIHILNVGTNLGTVTVNSTVQNIYPGSEWYCDSQEDPISNELLGCPSLTWDCAANGGTTFLIVRKGD
ncbi:MAG: hypothetical protein IPG12_14145 [Saprospiraceae bacterium]|nr:hypothetical protein [Saprospiraceae bacterium]